MAAEVSRAPTGEIKVKSVEDALAKYLKRTEVARDDYVKGIQNPKRDPTKAAISMRSTLEAKMASKATWDKWQEKLESVGFKGWQEGALKKGADRYLPGVRMGAKYWKQFYTQFKPHLEEGLRKVYALPRATIDDSCKRAETMIRHNAKFRYKKRYIPE